MNFNFLIDKVTTQSNILDKSAGNAGPPHNISSWFQCKGQGRTQDDTADHIPHDFYVIGTQEDPLGEREWADMVKSVLRNITNISFKQVSDSDKSFKVKKTNAGAEQKCIVTSSNIQVAIHTLWSIRIIVLVKPEHENRISHVFSDSVKTGIANTLGKHFHFSTSRLMTCHK